MRKVLAVLGIAGICLIIVAAVLWASFDVNRYRPQIEANLQAKLGRDVHLGEMSLSLIPPGFRVHNAVISEDPAFGSGKSFATVDTLYVRPRVLPLLRGLVEIQSLQLSRPALELIRNTKGVWNFTTMLQGRRVSLGNLKIDDGQVAVTDFLDQEPRVVYDHIDLTLDDYAPDKSFSVETRLHLPGAGDQLISFNGKAGPIQRDSLAHTPLVGTLELREVAVSALERFLKTKSLVNSDAVLTGKSEIKNDGLMAAKGHMEIRDARIRGVSMGYPISADYDVSSKTSERSIGVHQMTLKLNRTPVSIDGSINSATTPATLDLHVRTPEGSIAEMARLAAALGIAFDATNNVTGRMSFDVRAKGPADMPALDGVVSARNIRISGGDLQQAVEMNALELSFSPNVVRSNQFTARTGRTSVTAEVSLEGYATAAPQLHASLNTGNAELGELLRVARAYGFAGEDGLTGSGSIHLNVGVSGPLKETHKWEYTGTGAVSNATLRLPSLGAKPLEVRKASLRFTANSLAVEDLAFSIGDTTARGSLTAHNLAAPRVEFSLSADKINAAEWHAMAKPLTAVSSASPRQDRSRTNLLARATGTGQLAAQTVVYDPLVLSNVRSSVKLDEGIITMSPITAGLYGGEEVGSVEVNVREEPVSYTVKSKLHGIDANQFLSSVSSLKEMLYGVMSASTNGSFSASGSANNIARSLNGRVSVNLAEGRLANMDLLRQLAIIGKFTRTARAVEPFTRLIGMNGDFDITNGVARTNNLEAVIEDGSLAAKGTVDLANQKLDLHLTAVLSQDYSQTVGGTRVAGLLSTVLPNRRGEFVIPILVTGTLKSPQFAPDLAKMAQMKLENLVPTMASPDNRSTGILEEILRTVPDIGEPTPERPRPENVLQGIFQGVFGRSN